MVSLSPDIRNLGIRVDCHNSCKRRNDNCPRPVHGFFYSSSMSRYSLEHTGATRLISNRALQVLLGLCHIRKAMAETHTGQCYCGAVEIEVRGDPLEMGYCHCENCRRYSAAPVSAFTLWKKKTSTSPKARSSLADLKAATSVNAVIARSAAATS
jgi:hypothetical protein